MGLRIVDRCKSKRRDLTEAERLHGLQTEASHWAQARGQRSADCQNKFIDNFCRVKARLQSPAQVEELAVRIREDLKTRRLAGATVQSPVDIATLMELL